MTKHNYVLDPDKENFVTEFQPTFDEGTSTFIKGGVTIDWLFDSCFKEKNFFTGVRTYQREKVASVPWKQEVLKTILEEGYKSIPEIHIRVMSPLRFELTDGQQRTSAPLDYMQDGFPLAPKTIFRNTDYSGLLYSELPDEVKDAIRNYEISCKWYVNLDDQETSNLFIKILNNVNTMNHQEMRNAVLGVYSDFVRNTARDDGLAQYSQFVHPLFQRTTDRNGKQTLNYFSKGFKLNGRMEVDEWLQNLCYLFSYGKDWKKGISSQAMQTKWVKEIQKSGGIFAVNYTDEKLIRQILNLALNIISNYPNRQRLSPMVSLIMVCYAVSLIDITGKGTGRKLTPTVSLDPVKFGLQFDKIYTDWSCMTKRLFEKETMWTAEKAENSDDAPPAAVMQPFKQLFGGKNAVAIGTIKKVLDTCTPKEWGITKKDGKRAFTDEEKSQRLTEQGGKCFWTGVPLTLDRAVGDHYVLHSLGGETTMDNLVVTSKQINGKRLNMRADHFAEYIQENYDLDYDHDTYFKELTGA
jgi:hypothetical protein